MADEQEDGIATVVQEGPELLRARQTGKRVAFAIYGTLSAAFILLSTYQLTVEVHGLRAAPLAPRGAPNAPCVQALRHMTLTLDHAAASAASAGDEQKAASAFAAGILPDWSDANVGKVTQTCSGDPFGADAVAAVVRLRQAREHSLLRTAGELAPLRRDVAEYLAP